ncbi:MAG: ATP synthase F1 subunit delta [Patescibacteria group bacterium]
MKKISPQKYAQALYESVQGLNKSEVDAVVKNFIKVLIKKNNLKLVNKIVLEFSRYWQEQEGIIEARVTTVEHLTESLRKELEKQIKDHYQVNKVSLEEAQSEDLIGGFRLRVADQLLDASLSTRLDLLREELK